MLAVRPYTANTPFSRVLAMIRIGIVDCDTSHVVEFTKRLNHVGIAEAHWVEGATVVAAVPGTSQISPATIEPYVNELKKYNVAIVDKPIDLLGKIDNQPSGTTVIASGTSCRHQLSDLSEGHPKHMAEIIADALL